MTAEATYDFVDLYKDCVACEATGLIRCTCERCGGCEDCDGFNFQSCVACEGTGLVEVDP